MDISIEEQLDAGGLYPIVFPLSWALVDCDGNDEVLPTLNPDESFHRILATGELLAREGAGVSSDRCEAMMLTRPRAKVPRELTPATLYWFVDTVLERLTEQGIRARSKAAMLGFCALTTARCAMVVVDRMADGDDRMEIHYLVRSRTSDWWELTYLVRRAEIERWRPLLAEVDGPKGLLLKVIMNDAPHTGTDRPEGAPVASPAISSGADAWRGLCDGPITADEHAALHPLDHRSVGERNEFETLATRPAPPEPTRRAWLTVLWVGLVLPLLLAIKFWNSRRPEPKAEGAAQDNSGNALRAQGTSYRVQSPRPQRPEQPQTGIVQSIHPAVDQLQRPLSPQPPGGTRTRNFGGVSRRLPPGFPDPSRSQRDPLRRW